jgi:predicted Rossmann fold nucleotide-binding protein DprA/Smf involved in DNA uptake
MNLLYYSGIGSRRTPENIQELMVKLGHYLAGRGWVLRSGGAEGADTAFEKGCDQVHGRKEIFLPWKGYNNNKSPFFYKGSNS